MTVREIFYAPTGTLRAWWRVGGFVLVFFAANYAFSGVGRRLPGASSFAGALTVSYVVVLAAALLATFVMLRRVDGRAWSTAGLGVAQAKPAVLGLGLAIGFLAILLPSGALLMVHWLAPAAPTLGTGTSLTFAAQIALLMLPQSLAEELISRGYAFTAIREGAGPVAAIAITSLIFGALHLGNPGADARSFGIVVLAGVWLGAIVVLTKSVYAAWMAHFAWNFAIVGLLHAKVSGIAFPAPEYTVVDAGPGWATGGSWGPEGSAFAALAMIAAIGGLYRWQSRRPPELSNA